MADLFEYLNSINSSKEELDAKDYTPYVINMGLSQHLDTVLYANEMNRLHFIPKHIQYKFYLAAIRQKKRYGKWAKETPTTNIDALNTIKEYYGYSTREANMVIDLVTPKMLEKMRKELYKGGFEKHE